MRDVSPKTDGVVKEEWDSGARLSISGVFVPAK